MYTVQSILIMILEVLCCRIFYEIFGEKREKIKKRQELLLLCVLVLEIFLSAFIFQNIALLKTIVVITGIAVIMFCIIEITFVKSLILSFLFEAIMFVVDYLIFLLCMTVFKDIENLDNTYSVQGWLLVLLGKVFLFFVVIVIQKGIGNYPKKIMKDLDWLKFIFFPIYTICTIFAMISVLGNQEEKNRDLIFFVIAFGLVAMNIFVFYLINDIIKRETKIHENQIFRLRVENQTQMYCSISENFEKQRKRTHEFKNQIICIESLLKRNKLSEVKSYIEQISSGLKMELDSICTNHVIVDAILNTKYGEMTEKNIVFVFRINDLSALKLSDEDIVIILSNLLNNAIEACEKCKGKRIIKLKFVVEGTSVVISVKNTYEAPLFMRDNELLTTKEKGDLHGIGIHNIVDVIEKYGGSHVIKTEDNEFGFSIFIPNIVKKL